MVQLDRAELLRVLGLGAGAGLAGLAGAGPAAAATGAGSSPAAVFPAHPRWRIAFMAHDTKQPLFVPLQFGAEDACSLLGCELTWGGSARGRVSELARAIDAAITEKVDALALTLVDGSLLDRVRAALDAGIPVVAVYAHSAKQGVGLRVPLVGENADATGRQLGARLAVLTGSRRVTVAVSNPDDPVLESRIVGALEALERAGAKTTLLDVGDDAYFAEKTLERYLTGRGRPAGVLAVDPAATEGMALMMRKGSVSTRGLVAGGQGVLPTTLSMVAEGRIAFTVDEQPYLQGFVAAALLALSKLSGGLVRPGSLSARPRFLTKETVEPYVKTRSRFEGSSSRHRYPIR
jgi:simple sugar transport system substrate-binding protein